MEDKQIIDLFWQRSEQAIEALEAQYGGVIRNTAGKFLDDRQDVEECANDTCLGVWNSIPPQRPDPLISYVCRIARNIAVSRFHANRAEKRFSHYDLALDELQDCLPSRFDLETELEARELTRALDRFLETLSREDRVLFVRRYWFGDGVGELARARGCSVDRVSVRLYRIRKRLRKTLQKEGLPV